MGRDATEFEGLRAVLAGLEQRRRHVVVRSGCAIIGLGACALLTAAPVVFLALLGVESPSGTVVAELAARFPHWIEANQHWFPFALMGWLSAGIIGCFFTLRRGVLIPRWDYLAAYKQQVFTVVCRERFPGIHYEPGEGIGWRTFDDTRLFPFASDIYQSEDRFMGRWGDTDVCFADAWAKRERKRWTRKGRKTEYEEYFRGIIFIADFHKHFHSTTRLIPSGEKAGRARGEERAELEDPVFEELFDVWTTDQIDVRYVLSSSMMARFAALSRRFRKIRARLSDERLLLLLPSPRRLFEPSLLRHAASRLQVDGFVHDVESCLAVVEALNLNTRIWSKH